MNNIAYCICKPITGFMTSHWITDVQFTTLVRIHIKIQTILVTHYILSHQEKITLDAVIRYNNTCIETPLLKTKFRNTI